MSGFEEEGEGEETYQKGKKEKKKEIVDGHDRAVRRPSQLHPKMTILVRTSDVPPLRLPNKKEENLPVDPILDIMHNCCIP